MLMAPSCELAYVDGLKYRNSQTFIYRLKYDYGIQGEWAHPDGWYRIVASNGSWWIIVSPGCCWDGATMYFDWIWMMYPSLIHDILHWLIKRGVISVLHNNLIDQELEHMVRTTTVRIPWWQGGEHSKPARARIIRRATNVARQKREAGPDHAIKRIKVL